jgi:hypothetical protein
MIRPNPLFPKTLNELSVALGIYWRELASTVNKLDSIRNKFGDIQNGNYAEFESDGTLRFYGDATVWQDVDFPIIIRTTGANIPTLVALQGNVTAPQWGVNDFSVCEAQELIHAWKEGSEIQWHVHLVTNGLDATGFTKNKQIKFTDPDRVNIDNYDLLSMWVSVKEWEANKNVEVFFDVGNKVNLNAYLDTTKIDEWQRVLIPYSDLSLTEPVDIKTLTLKSTGNIGLDRKSTRLNSSHSYG